MEALELVLLEKQAYIDYLSQLDDFNIIEEDDFSKELQKEFTDKLNPLSDNIVLTSENIQMKKLLDKTEGKIIALKGEFYFKNYPLFLISIPKAGTHLLYNLADAFGYKFRHTTPENPEGGYCYFLEYSNSHTEAKRFFNDSVYTSDFGNRAHPFTTSPCLFIYRNPLDILVSEANYYHKERKTLFGGYLQNKEFDERLQTLISDKWVVYSIEERINKFIGWLFFENVIPISFEELIGCNGGGDDALQQRLIWSLQLKLKIDGKPSVFASKVFNKESDTFFKGQINTYKSSFKRTHWDSFNSLDLTFMDELGYDTHTVYSKKIDFFRYRELSFNPNLEFPPILKETNYYNYNIVFYKKKFFAVNRSLGPVDLSQEIPKEIIIDRDIKTLKHKIRMVAFEK